MPTMRAEQGSMAVVAGAGEGGIPIFAVLVKRTYDVVPGRTAERSARDRPLTAVDQYFGDGDPETTSVEHETDLVPYKLGTDVVFVGSAHAPGGRPTARLDVALSVAGRRKTIRVIGDRRAVHRPGRPPAFTDPEPFTTMPLRYERAYGGTDVRSIPAMPVAYPRNPIGTGFVLGDAREIVDALRLPNLEDPADPLTPERLVLGEPGRWNRQPLPQGLGWFHRAWYPRCSFVGAVPGFVRPGDPLREEEMGLVPKDQVALARRMKLPSFDLRFNNGASPGLVLPHLSGGEELTLTNLTPEGSLTFQLPRDPPRLFLDIGAGERALEAVLHTVCIRGDEAQVDLVWRGALDYPGVDWLPELKCLDARVE